MLEPDSIPRKIVLDQGENRENLLHKSQPVEIPARDR
jgi:hypothetical protein